MSDGVCKREDLGMCDRVCKRKDERRCVVEDVRGKMREDARAEFMKPKHPTPRMRM